MKKLVIILAVVLALLLVLLAGLTIHQRGQEANPQPSADGTSAPVATIPSTEPPTTPVTEAATMPPETEAPTVPPTEPPLEAAFTADSDPANWSMQWDVIQNGQIVDTYQREDPISFDGDDYFALPGISSFRGSNYRTDASYGTANITSGTISKLWGMPVGALDQPGWGGCGWTGQPLVVQWDEETKAIMNLYESKKQKEGLVEAIYAKMDGYVHFIDMEDGSYTRDPLYVGMTFKGSGAIDPRGYPLLYLGAGLSRNGKTQTIFVISLIDGSILYERSGHEELSHRWWFAFDGAPLVDAETDTLIWAGESGILYTIKLNTQYDKAAGTITVNPDAPVMSRYSSDYTRAGRYNGYESSITAVQNYLYVGDNSGLMQCIDVNTMELVWAQNIIDDINATPVFEWGDDGRGYIYTAPSMDYSGSYSSELPVCKLDAQTGEIIWTYNMSCKTDPDVPGGMLASPLLGRKGSDLENLVIFSMGRSPSMWCGTVVAFDKETGDVVWQFETGNYMWSSPVALYTEEGKSYLFQADASGNCYLMEGATGKVVDVYRLGETVESSPVAFNDRVILGTRSAMYLFEIS